jgi:hypothetical protein
MHEDNACTQTSVVSMAKIANLKPDLVPSIPKSQST